MSNEEQERSGETSPLDIKAIEGGEIYRIPWDFLDEESPDYINDPIEKVEKWVNGLPMSEEDRESLMDIVLEERAKVSQPQP